MFRSRFAIGIACQLTFHLATFTHLAQTLAQEPAASAAELATMIRSIDPYRPTGAVSGPIRIYGSSAMDAMAHGWADGFTQFQPNAKVEIHGAPEADAYAQLVKVPGSIAMVSHPVTEEEIARLKKQGLKNPVAFPVAREALAVFVNAANPVSEASGERLREIFSTIMPAADLKWSALGATGPLADKPIHLISRTENCGTQKFLQQYIFQELKMRKALSEHPSNAQVLQAISQDPLAMAICGMRSSGDKVKRLQLSIRGEKVRSDDHAVLSGTYPFTRPLTLIVDMGERNAAAMASQEFVRYALCRAGQSQTIMVGYFPVDLPLLRASLARLGSPSVR